MLRKGCCGDSECRLSEVYFPDQLPFGFEKDWQKYIDNLIINMGDYTIMPLENERKSEISSIIHNSLDRNWQVYGPLKLIEDFNPSLMMRSIGGMVTALNLAYEIIQEDLNKRNLSMQDLEALVIGGLVRDIGLTSIVPSLFDKESFDEKDWERMQRHPRCGINILEGFFSPKFSKIPDLEKILTIVGGHHSPRYGKFVNSNYLYLAEIMKIGDVAFSMHFNMLNKAEDYSVREVVDQMYLEHNDENLSHNYDEDLLLVLESLIH